MTTIDDRHRENSLQNDGDPVTTFTAGDMSRQRNAEPTAPHNVADTQRLRAAATQALRILERRALVLAGGGIIGVLYEIGVLAALEEAFPPGPFNQHFDLFVGTSAGAVTAAFVANGAQPSEMFRALRDDLDSPFNFRPEDV